MSLKIHEKSIFCRKYCIFHEFFLDFLNFFLIFFLNFCQIFWQNFCKNFGRCGPDCPENTEVPCIFCTKVPFWGGCPYFSLSHKSAKYTFVQQGWVGPEGTRNTKECTNVHTCMYICTSPPPRYQRRGIYILT